MSNPSSTTDPIFERAMLALASAFARDLTPDVLRVYRIALTDLSSDEIAVAVGLAVRHERFWPAPAVLRTYARPEPNATALAEEAFAQIESMGHYNPTGYIWREREIETRFGPCALRAFRAIGGSDAWAERSHVYRRKDFVEVFVACHREQQHAERVAALPGAQTRRLTPVQPNMIEAR